MSKPSGNVFVRCKKCDTEFMTTNYKLSKGQGKYCSKKCYDEFQCQKKIFHCDECGAELLRNESKKYKHYFCNNDCSSKFLSRERKGKSIVSCNCEMCGKEYKVSKSREETTRFCSRKCLTNWQKINFLGENSAVFKNRVPTVCNWCNEEFGEMQHKIKLKQLHFCSRKCKDEYHTNVYVKSPEFKELARKTILKNLQEGRIKTVDTLPQRLVNNLLDTMGIEYKNEYTSGHYSYDIYLLDYHIFIEINGTYWHCDNRFYERIKYKKQLNRILRDKSKRTFTMNKHGRETLYLWEHDIINNIELCKKLLEECIFQNGVLDNYHSFNFILEDNGTLKTNEDSKIIVPYMEYDPEKLNEITDLSVKQEISQKKPDKHVSYQCEWCNKKCEQLLVIYNRANHHFCSPKCNTSFYGNTRKKSS